MKNKFTKSALLLSATACFIGIGYATDVIQAAPMASVCFDQNQVRQLLIEEMPPVQIKATEQEVVVQDTLLKRLSEDKIQMEQMESLSSSMNWIKNLTVKSAVVDSELGDTVKNKISDVALASTKDQISDALGKTLRPEFEAMNPTFDKCSVIEYRRLVHTFLKGKEIQYREGADEAYFKKAIERMLIASQTYGLQDYSVQNVFLRKNSGKSEFAGALLYDEKTGKVLITFADGTVKTGGTTPDENGHDVDSGYLARFNDIRYSVLNAVRDLQKNRSDGGLNSIDIIAVGEKAGASDALQSVVAIKEFFKNEINVKAVGVKGTQVFKNKSVEHVSNLFDGNVAQQPTAGVIGFGMPQIYMTEASRKAVDSIVGDENIISTKQEQVVAPTPTVVEKPKQGFFSRAGSAIKSVASKVWNAVKFW